MNIISIQNEIKNEGLKSLVAEILSTVDDVKSGKKNYRQGLVELQGYKTVVQIMAIEVMRQRITTNNL